MCGAGRVPKERDGGPSPGVLILEFSTSIQKKTDYGDVADEEGVVQRASKAASDACNIFGEQTRTSRTFRTVDLDRRHSPKADGQLQRYPILLRT